MNSDAKLLKTKDGSDTIFLSNLNEHYHSIFGALQESEHVYLKMGLDYLLELNSNLQEINVFEVGMGTGLNVILSIYWALEHQKNINFTTLEPFPLSWELMQNYSLGNLKEREQSNEYFEKIHTSIWNQKIELNKFFSLFKIENKLEDFQTKGQFDIIFFDAFAPNKQEEVWNLDNIEKTYSLLKKEGILVTYCAKGSVRRNFELVGFTVQRIEGPPGKREMLRCIK